MSYKMDSVNNTEALVESGNPDVIRSVVGELFAVLIIAHRRLQVLVSQVSLNLLWLRTTFYGQRAASMP